MVQVVPVKCPSCGAKTRARGDTVVCEYCGTESVVQRRSGLLERKVEVSTGDGQLPVATQSHSAGWAVGALLVPVMLVVGPLGLGAYELLSLRWNGTDQPILVDVNGDGVLDPIGFAKRGSDSMQVAAFDGASGSKLWATSTIGDFSDVISGKVAVVEDTLLYVWDGGEILGFDLATGEDKWTAAAQSEKVRQVCIGAAGVAVLKMADDSYRHVALSSGSVTSQAESECKPAWSNQREFAADLEVKEWVHRQIGNVRSDFVLRRNDGPWIAFGYKAKGSRVAMLAATEDGVTAEALEEGHDAMPAAWETEIPAVDPLKTEGVGGDVALSDRAAFSYYEFDERPPRLTAFSLTDGKRLWDVEIDREAPMTGVEYGSGRVFVSLWGTLLVYDAKSGNELYRVGM